MVEKILTNRTFKAVVLTVWVVISMIVLLSASIGYIFSSSLPHTIAGILVAIFSIVPVFVYYDIKRK